jgi:hypothetical protein
MISEENSSVMPHGSVVRASVSLHTLNHSLVFSLPLRLLAHGCGNLWKVRTGTALDFSGMKPPTIPSSFTTIVTRSKISWNLGGHRIHLFGEDNARDNNCGCDNMHLKQYRSVVAPGPNVPRLSGRFKETPERS